MLLDMCHQTLPSRHRASHVKRCSCPGQNIINHSVHMLSLGRRGSDASFGAAAVAARLAASHSNDGTVINNLRSEKEFGSVQKKASTRLHRFYVPYPLGPTAKSLFLQELLADPEAMGTAASRVATASLPASPAVAFTRASDLISPAPPSGDGGGVGGPLSTVVLEGEEARHAARSLRLQPGDRVELCDGLGNLLEGLVIGSDKQRVWVAPEGPVVHSPWQGSRWVVAVACTTLKGGRAEWLVEKLTELGAYMMVPVITERSQAGGKAKFRTRGSSKSRVGIGAGVAADSDGGSDDDYQPGRLERVAIAATKQSLRSHALHLAPPTTLADVLPLVRRATGGCSNSSRSTNNSTSNNSSGADGCSGRDDMRRMRASDGPSAQMSHQAPVQADTGLAPAGLREQCDSTAEGVDGSTDGTASLTSSSNGSGRSCGGASFCLVAVAGAPPLATVLRDVQGRGEAAAAAVLQAGPGQYGEVSVGDLCNRVESRAALGGGTDTAPEAPLRVIFIGPEGDFTPAELETLVQAGARPVGLGPNRLRTETAAVGLLAACLLTEEGA
ncbi:hypothetical protein VaNZ11_013696 [Volvox africanus]|uniref:16S rRNA (uracil(1498)-N(3))-methyltransferase n=1 Tax=Volvox africanus TaxID=51714 RepID=A0ABQ5SI90_9CHLO|nr:hypothetical protein VaNZ11_013696 [Volvox africanus]